MKDATHFIEVWKTNLGEISYTCIDVIEDLKHSLYGTTQVIGCKTLFIFKIKAK